MFNNRSTHPTNINYLKYLLTLLAILLAFPIGYLVSVGQTEWLLVIPALIIALFILAKPYWGLVIFVMLLPLESAFLALGNNVASVTRLLGILVFVSWMVQSGRTNAPIRIPKHLILAAGFVVFGSMSYLWAYRREVTTERILTAVQLLMLMVLVVNLLHQNKQVKTLVIALFIGCLVVTLLGLLGVGASSRGQLLSLQDQSAKEYGAYVGLVSLLGSIVFVFEKRWYRWLGLLPIMGTIIPLIRINQRGIFLALGIAWLVIAILTRQKFRAIVVIALFFIGVNYSTTLLLNSGVINEYLADRLTLQNVIETGGTGRSEIYGVGIRMFLDNILGGVGWGNFPAAYNNYIDYRVFFQSAFRYVNKDPHNDFLGVAGELGIIGLIFFISLVLSVFIKNIKLFSRIENKSSNKILLLTIIALMTYAFSIGLTSTFLWRKVYWLILGLGIIYPELLLKERSSGSRPIQKA